MNHFDRKCSSCELSVTVPASRPRKNIVKNVRQQLSSFHAANCLCATFSITQSNLIEFSENISSFISEPHVMSNIKAAMKVADQIILRVFDQRPFTSGEIEFMVKEFGHDKINLEENFEKLLSLNQNACIIADTNLENLFDSNEKLTRNYCDRLSSLNEKAKNLTNLEEKFKEKEDKVMAAARSDRAKRLQDYQNDCEENISKMRESLEQEKLELEHKYRIFEQNLLNKSEK